MGVLGYFISDRSIFFLVLACAVPTIASLRLIRPVEIDYARARGGEVRGGNARFSGAEP
jgi:hypothetical protein